jgi:putative peptide zinc metalloprotease protein
VAEAQHPQIVEDIESWPLFPGVQIIGSAALDRYISVPAPKAPVVRDALSLFDGTRSLEEISGLLRARGCKVDVNGLHTRLAEAGLLIGSKPTRELAKLGVELFEIPTGRLMASCRRTVCFLFRPLVVLSALLIAVAAVLLATGTLGRAQDPHISSAAVYSLLGVGIFFSMALHELAHAFTALRHGLLPSKLKISGYLVVVPVAVLTIPGLYTIAANKRIQVWVAGIWTNLTIGSLAVIAVRFAAMPPLFAHLLTKLALANCVIAAWNLIPFLPTDGYFILTTLLRRANLRPKAWRALIPGRRGRASASPWLIAYGLASASLMIAIMFWNAAAITMLVLNSITGRIVVVIIFASMMVLLWRRRMQHRNAER